ncbi:MAG: hypothetical protein J7M14_02030, partial [Planctomycetes bacterium]|nr:hypothetical protein [Planctomycetota bacterium]
QMIDFVPHGPQGNALRRVLSGWFHKREQAKDEFAAAGYDVETLIAAAADVECPYAIDVVRKAKIATAKLTGAQGQLV